MADPGLLIRGGGGWGGAGLVIQTLDKRGDGLKKTVFRPFGPQIELKIRRSPGRPLDPPLDKIIVHGGSMFLQDRQAFYFNKFHSQI